MRMLFQKWFVTLSAAVIVAGCGAAPQGTNISVSDVGNVEGTVTDTSTGTPLSGVTVQIGDKSDVTGDNGVYSIQDMDVGSRTITATKTGYQSYNGTVTVSKGTTVSHNIEMTTPGTSADTTPPTVSSTSPINGATAVALDTSVTVTFSEAMDCSTITTTTFTLKDGTNNTVTGTISTCNSTSAVFTTSSSLSYNTTYSATITTSVRDAAGNAMASSYVWNFTTVATSWSGAKQFGTSSYDSAYSISVDANGNVYVAGITHGGLDGNSNAGESDGFLIKYDSSGVRQWTKQFGTVNQDEVLSFSVDATGNIYVAGQTYGGLDGNSNAGLSDGFLSKYDSSGAKQWTRQFGTESYDSNPSVSVDATGNVYVTGTTSGGLDGNSNAGLSDGFLSKYDSSGAKQWTRQFGTESYDWATGVSVDATGNIYVAGGTNGGLDGNSNAGLGDGFLVKYDSSGVKQWTRQFGTASYDSANDVSVDINGNIYVAGITQGGLDGNSNAGLSDGFLVKYDSSGVKQWTRQFGTINGDFANGGVSVDASGNIYVVGETDGGLDGNVNAGGRDGFIVKYDADGNKQ